MIYFEEAMRVLLANKIRTFLTITGLIIGVGAVIAIQTLGAGMSGAVNGALAGLADNSFFVFPNQQQGDFRKAMLHLSDFAALKRTVPNLLEAIPFSTMRTPVRAIHNHANSIVYTISHYRFETTNFQYGRNITADEEATGANLAILSDASYHRLFPEGGDPTGTSLHIGDHRFVVAGVLAPQRTGLLNSQQGGDVALAYTTFNRDFLHGRPVFAGVFYVEDTSQMGLTEVAVVKELRAIRHNSPDIQYISFDRKLFNQFIDTLFGVLTMIVGLIGAVSLLVAGIGVMNIMLVSVTERTREIGVRKAIGATQAQILLQFFIEALTLCSLGCGIGLIIGLAVGDAVNQLALVKLSGNVVSLPWMESVIIAAVFAIVATLAFGTYPAYRAARLDPIEALRYE